MITRLKQDITALLQDEELLKDSEIQLNSPPNPEMGDFAFPVFEVAKREKKNPADVAKEIAQKLETCLSARQAGNLSSTLRDGSSGSDSNEKLGIIERVESFGPYVNFFLHPAELARRLLPQIDETFGAHSIGRNQQVLVEYGCPNPMKIFHLGHLRNLITGEALVRVLENAGYDVKRVNYQGDVGMHIAKSLWGIERLKDDFAAVQAAPLSEQLAFLGKAYAYGATEFESSPAAKVEILDYNKKVYEQDPDIAATYETARRWSLHYFDEIYQKLGSHFDRLYFESEVFASGRQLVLEGLEQGIFKKSDGAIIYEGSKHGLHDRVFINSEGFPTYEAKDMGLAQLHFSEFSPERVIHVVGKEQREYFQVVFKALEELLPQTSGKEYHLVGGYLQLKGNKKMSSRTGNVISGDELISLVEERVAEIMKNESLPDQAVVARAVAVAALKYAMLKVGVSQDMAFDMEASVSTTGDSGPYLLYIVARINSIFAKAGAAANELSNIASLPATISPAEKQLLLELARFPAVTQTAAESYDPSSIAKYCFSLAQYFNQFYAACPVLDADAPTREFRLALLARTRLVMERGLYLLGIATVKAM